MRENGLNPDNYRSGDSGSSGSSDNGGCFLTTACVQAKGLLDTCYELRMLRDYRDTYVAYQKGGPEAINEYYEIAPKIVDAINLLPNAKEIWNSIYINLIQECIFLIVRGHLEEAFQYYKEYTLDLKNTYII